ncbi:hypothetical protein TRFO_03352 [Tritrichomonas foetus]|uniref:Uncharacterized protein n=1 Tax=Tritrichomonas foetus TaxID=1144522 RepID=A0A1J4KQQ5_9EUKA|nr:hypothetical protein TRFO_03352 [Tritrichomonas foetus]|eukprot:OHT13587.1 hypothetical protein TRFO_03352 [Tritrichomonas foetus]
MIESNSSEEEDIQMSDSSEGDFAPAADQSLINPMILAAKTKENNYPQLIDFARQKHDLQLIANNLHQLLTAPGFVKYSQETRQDLELIIRAFITGCIEYYDIKNDESGFSRSEVQRLHDELLDVQKELETCKASLKTSEKRREEQESEIKMRQVEIDGLYVAKAQETQKLNEYKKDAEKTISNIKTQNDQLSDKLRDVLDQLKIKEYADERNQNHFKELSQSATNANSEIIKLKDKISMKNDKIEELEQQIHDLSVRSQTLEDDNQKLAVYLNAVRSKLNESKRTIAKFNSGQVIALQQENEKLRAAFTAVTKQFESQNTELINLRNSQIEATSLLHRQIEVIAEYDRSCESLTAARQNNYNLSNQLNQIKVQSMQRDERLNNLESIMSNIMSLTEAETPEEVPIRVVKLKEYGCLENQRLVSAFEDQLRFMATLVNSEIFYGRSQQQLNGDASFAEKLQIEMIRCRKFIEDNTVAGADEIPEEDVEQFHIDTSNREDFAILSTQVLRNEVLRKYSEQLKKDSDALHEIADLYGETDVSILPDFLESKNKQMETFLEQLTKSLEIEQSENTFNDILEKVDLNNAIFDEIKTIIKFEGNIEEVPQQIESLTRQIMNSTTTPTSSKYPSNYANTNNTNFNNNYNANNNFSNNANFKRNQQEHLNEDEEEDFSSIVNSSINFQSHRETEILREQLSLLKTDFDNENYKLQTKINQLQKKLNDAQILLRRHAFEKKKLKEKLTNVTQQNDELTKREVLRSQALNVMNTNYRDLEGQLNEYKQRNIELHNEMKTKMENADQRLDNIIKEERSQHQIELNNIQQRFNTLMERQKESVEKKNQRIKSLKDRLSEVINSYEVAFKKQKETIRILREKTDKCINKTEEIVSTKDETILENELTIIRSEKEALAAKVGQLTEQLNKAQTVRDTFWKAQISMVENSAKKAIDDEVTTVLKKIASVARCDPTADAIIATFEQRETRDFSVALNSIDIGSMKQLEEWEKWSRQLFANVNHGEIFAHSSKELRFVIGEMALSSISHHVLLSRLESLRQQKVILMTGKTCNRTDDPPEIRSLMVFVVCVIRLKRRAGQITPHMFQAGM